LPAGQLRVERAPVETNAASMVPADRAQQLATAHHFQLQADRGCAAEAAIHEASLVAAIVSSAQDDRASPAAATATDFASSSRARISARAPPALSRCGQPQTLPRG
jgi:hypothetical protein